MKKVFISDFAVGLLALAGLSLIGFLSLEVGGRGGAGAKSKTYKAKFSSVSGLVKRTPVEIAGIHSGFLESIALDGSEALVTLKINKNIPVYQNASLAIRDRGMLGDKFIQLSPGTPDAELLPDNGMIELTKAGMEFDTIQAALIETSNAIKDLLQSDNPKGALGQTILNLRDATGNLNQVILDNQKKIGQILTNMDAFSSDLRGLFAENKDDLNTLIASLNDVAVGMKRSLGENGNVTQATEKLNQTLTTVQNVMSKIERGEGTVGKLINDETTVNKLNDAIDGVNDTLGLFRRVQLGVRYRGEFLASDKQLQNLFSVSIWPSPDKFLLVELVDTPRGETKLVDTTISSGTGAVLSSTRTVQTDDKILLNLQLGKRFWDATARVGIMRNEGGLGLDYHLFRDKLVLTSEAFNFSRLDDRFQLRAYATLYLYKNLLFTGGVDDILTKKGNKNPFFGAGIQFTDNDLKALIPALGRGF